jgi:MFS family permease
MTIGAVGTVLAVFMVSLCKEYYQFFLAQGVFLGGSMGFLITPSIATLSQHFVRHRGITTGIAISGSSLGGVIWPIAINQLLNHKGVSFGWTMRIMGFMMMPLVAFAVLAVRLPKAKVVPISEDGTGAPTKPAKKKKTDLSFVKSPTFILFAIGLIIYYLAFSGPMFFTPSYAVEVLHSSSSFAFYTLAILNAASMFGRILPGLLADYFGNFNICALAAVVSGVVSFCWTAADTEGGLVAWSLAYGFASGAMLSLQMTCIAQISNPEARGTSMGLIMMSTSLAILFGSPIAGKLTEHGYIAISMYCGACLVLGGLLIWLARLRLNKKLFAKV